MRILIKTVLVLFLIVVGSAAKKLLSLSGNPQLGFAVFFGSFLAAGAVIKYKNKNSKKGNFEIDKTISSDKDNK